MTAHPAIAAVPKTGQPSPPLLQALLVNRLAYIIGDAEDPTAFDPRGEGGGPVTLVLGYKGLWFWLDGADSTTANDGTTCIVTSATGGRYKVTCVDLRITYVKSKTVTTPPSPTDPNPALRPVNGDSYIVPVAATGAWAGKTNWIMTWVAARKEWFGVAPKPGWFVWMPASGRDIAYHFDAVQTAWVTGLGAGAADSASVPPSALIWDNRVQNQTTNTPPSAAQGIAYIIGSSPTGAWAGNAGKLAIRESAGTNSTYVIYTPKAGQRVYDIALGIDVLWAGTAWISAAGAIVQIKQTRATRSGSISLVGSGAYTWSNSVGPTTSLAHSLDQTSLLFTARRSGARLRIGYYGVGNYEYGTSAQVTVAVFVDNESTCRDYRLVPFMPTGLALADVEFDLDIADSLQHEYKVRWFWNTNSASSIIGYRRMTISELADLQPLFTDL